MNIYEAERIANSDEERGQLVAQVALLNHKNDNFMLALKLLKDEHLRRVSSLALDHTLQDRCYVCKRIAELEEVK